MSMTPGGRSVGRPPDAVTFAAPETSILGLLDSRAERFAQRPALAVREDGRWRSTSYAALAAGVRALAARWVTQGVGPGDRVAILSESRPEWAVAFFAAVHTGATVVPLDPKLTRAELDSILADARPRVLAASDALLVTAEDLAPGLGISRVEPLGAVLLDGTPEGEGDSEPPASRERGLEETALIVYTSGTTGSPKGVMITFGNLLFQVQSFERAFPFGPGDRFLSILPLNHLLELTGGLLGVLHLGGTVYYAPGLFPQDIADAFREHRIHALLGVPLFFRTLKGGIEREVSRKGAVHRGCFRAALALADLVPSRRVRRVLFRPITRRLGGCLRAFVCGGAPLEAGVARFFERLGIPVLEGYGLTEASPVVSVNTLRANRTGSVGRPLPGVDVRIVEDGENRGEILTRGPHVMRGYYRREELTGSVLDAEGWLHTGDLGELDADGFLFVRGRRKDLIVLPGGKKVHPEEVEICLGRSPAVKELCVLGRHETDAARGPTEEVCAVVVPSTAARETHAGDEATLERHLREEIERLARDLSPFKRPTRILLHLEDLPKTSTRKIRRPLVKEWLDRRLRPHE